MRIYSPPLDRLLALGEPLRIGSEGTEEKISYRELGIQSAHVADLVAMAGDPELNAAPGESAEVWAPLHAWRALGELRAVEAVPGLLAQANARAAEGDDWFLEEIPIVLGQIGAEALPLLAAFLADRANEHWARIMVADALASIAIDDAAQRPAIIAILAERMARFDEESPEFNGGMVGALFQLNAVEAAEPIERAYASGRVDEGVCGPWEELREVLGVPGLGLVNEQSPKNPNSLREWQTRWKQETFAGVIADQRRERRKGKRRRRRA